MNGEIDPNTAMLLGEVRGQLREIIHNMNNQGQERAAMARQLAKLEQVPDRLTAIESRLNSLETDRHRRDGAMGFGVWLLKSPLVGWIAGAGVAVWAYVKGVFH